MKTSPRFPNWRLLLAVALVAAGGCATLQYRTVQKDFETAVRTDNERSTMPFLDPSAQYQAVASQLTPEYIARLDEQLRPNAWTLRAVSQWRTGEFATAETSALEGLNEITRQSAQAPQLVHGRDSIILTMLLGLVEDSRLRQRFIEHGPADVTAHYEEYAARFRTAVRALAEAHDKLAAPTPPEVRAYWSWQTWRLLQNWGAILSQLPPENAAEPNLEADTLVKNALANRGLAGATNLAEAMTALESSLPSDHPYRRLIELERQR